ncbi:MAG: carboxyl transferase domain-containing protein, partial [Amphiplicatus sp.]
CSSDLIANNGPIDADGASKAAQFIQLMCQAGSPVVFLQNTTGYLVGTDAEQRGIVKHGSKMIQAVTNMTVPKITLHIGASFGAGNYGMCGRAFGPDFIFAWPSNRIAVMGGEQAAKTMRIVAEEGARKKGEEPNKEFLDGMTKHVVDTYDAESRALFATARLWDDGLIDPRDSRKVLAFCLDTVAEARARELRPSTFGVARM